MCASAAMAVGTTFSAKTATARDQALAFYHREIVKFQQETWYWQLVMGVPRTDYGVRRIAATSINRLQHLDALWRRREQAAYVQAQHPPQLGAWLCIHRYEGSWTDSGAPYYGGLQMDLSFQQAYGGQLLRTKGTADHWSPLEQIWTAVRAHRTRGFTPWPNTARMCGLL